VTSPVDADPSRLIVYPSTEKVKEAVQGSALAFKMISRNNRRAEIFFIVFRIKISLKLKISIQNAVFVFLFITIHVKCEIYSIMTGAVKRLISSAKGLLSGFNKN
jgi:hypothetical protein